MNIAIVQLAPGQVVMKACGGELGMPWISPSFPRIIRGKPH